MAAVRGRVAVAREKARLALSPQVAKLPFVVNDGKWHHICITWTTRDGVWEAYQDGTQGGSGENLAPYHPIKPQGVLVLGQEQVRPAAGGWEWASLDSIRPPVWVRRSGGGSGLWFQLSLIQPHSLWPGEVKAAF